MPEEPFRRELRVVIRKARERLGMSQADFGEALGRVLGHPISQSQVSDWERGRNEPAGSVLLAVAEIAGGSVDGLRSGDGPVLLQRVARLEDELAETRQTVSNLEGALAQLGRETPATASADQPEASLPSVALAVVVHEGRALMTRRRRREGPFEWNFISGEVEAGETPEQAAVREVEEEVGLQAEVMQRLGERVQPVSKRHMVYLVCRVIGGHAVLVDHEENSEVQWCTLGEVRERLRSLAEIPGGLYPPLFEHLERALIRESPDQLGGVD